MSVYWELQNPKESLASATISESPLGYHVSVKWKAFNTSNDLYAYRTLVAAKRYFGREYQNVKDGNEKPVWERKEISG